MTSPSQVDATSADGTIVTAFVEGSGPPLLLVHGTTADHTRWAPLVPLLHEEFTLLMLDRRGRGGSARESSDYAIEREGEDLVAVLDTLDEPGLVFGHSYGASVTLTALDRLPNCAAALLYEPPFATTGNEVFTVEQLARWQVALDEGRREDLLEMFYREVLRFGDAAVAGVRALPAWPARIAAVHTAVREGWAVRSFTPRAMPAPVPVRFLLGDSTAPHLTASTLAAAAAVSGSELAMLPGQSHVAIDSAPEMVANHVRETWRQATR